MNVPTLAEIIAAAIESRLNDLFGPMPAIVTAFNPGGPGQAPSVDVQPVVQRAIPSEADPDTLVSEPLPVVPNVPVVYPGGATARVTFPLAPGDTVLLVPLMLSIAQWRLTGAAIVSPVNDQALHHLGNCVAIPCLTADVATVAGVDPVAFVVESADIRLGSALAVSYAADATKVEAQLVKIAASLASVPAPTPYVFPDIPPNDTVACTKVKVE